MDITKHLEFFNPIEMSDKLHIIGVGAIGSTLCEMLARLGLSNIHIYDFDTVDPHNIANQVYFNDQIKTSKLDAIEDTMKRINPDVEITKHPEGWKSGTRLNGYIFLAVDNIEIRKAIVKENETNPNIKAMFDFRMGLEDAQHYASDWTDLDMKRDFYASMDFTHEEAKEAMPVSACGTTLSVISTIRMIVSCGVSNFINFVKGEPLKKIILINAFKYFLDAF